jgi:hypothetical protein
MRFLLSLCLFVLALSVSLAQTDNEDLFRTLKTDATVRVQRHSMGADLVEITLLDPAYPERALREQIAELGAELHSEPRGVAVTAVASRPNDLESTFIKASFAVDGLSNPATGTYRLEPIARALAGGPPGHEIHGILVNFFGLAPGPQTLRTFGGATAAVTVQGGYSPGPIGLEYRIALHTQNRKLIDIPDSTPSTQVLAANTQPKKSDIPWFLYAAFGFGAVGLGALVYSVTLRSAAPRTHQKTRYPNSGSSRNR